MISSMVLGLLDQLSTTDLLTIVSERIAKVFNTSGTTRAVALDIFKTFEGFDLLVFFTDSLEFWARHLTLFCLFSVIDDFEWLWMGGLHKDIQLTLAFLKTSFLVLHFSYNTLMTFLLMLLVILLSMLTILLPILSVIKYLICGNN